MIYIELEIIRVDMNETEWLRKYLRLYGFLSLIVIPTVPFFFRDIFMWEPKNTPLELMIVSIYFVLGIQMLNESRKPEPSKSLVDFIILASLAHSVIMLAFAENINHILFDVIPISSMAIWPLIFYPWGRKNFLIN